MTQNSQLTALRSKHPTFTYHSYDYSLEGTDLNISWHFSIEPNIEFHPKLVIQNITKEQFNNVTIEQLENLIFNLGLVETISYWKATCSPTIIIKAGQLDEEQIEWWHNLFIKGLGEFFYTNGIDFTEENFLTIQSDKERDPSTLVGMTNTAHNPKPKIIIPIGGGKDSAVTAELLKNLDPQPQTWSLNPIPASIATSKIAGYDTLHTSHRTIDPTLLELNNQGYLNGHTPFSAYLAFFYALVGTLTGADYIALSNEQSANEANTTYKDHEINHQYSKTFEFENKFREYSDRFLQVNKNSRYEGLKGAPHDVVGDGSNRSSSGNETDSAGSHTPQYFSLLRPLHELQIAKLFATHAKEHFSTFRSCNVGQKQGIWCHHCPKCLFAFLMLFPFLEYDQIIGEVFETNLFEDETLLNTAYSLVTPDQTKPFECVGSYEESKMAFYMSIKKYQEQGKDLPIILKEINNQVLANEKNLDERVTELLSDWNENHDVPEELENVLKQSVRETEIQRDKKRDPSTMVGMTRTAIYGLGREGLSTYKFLRKQNPNLDITLIDTKPLDQLSQDFKKIIKEDDKVEFLSGLINDLRFTIYETVYLSPGISQYQSEIQQAKQKGVQFSSATQLFFDNAPGKVIGITGSKGKSTTTAMIHHVLSQYLPDVRLAGNIGIPALDTLEGSNKDTIFVIELSSHQLSIINSSPQIAVIQNIFPEHLDYYPTYQDYINAKGNIIKYQNKDNLLIYYSESEETKKIADESKSTKKQFNNETIEHLLKELNLHKNDIPLVGQHNLLNIIPAILIGQHFDLTNQQIAQAIKTFKPLPHRLELVADINGVKYYNDSLATNPDATIQAIKAFENKPIILITGGYDRGLDYSGLAKEITTANIKHLILLPDTGEKILDGLRNSKSVIHESKASSMPEAVESAKNVAQAGDIVLMSPASASFNMFKDYADRGNQFKESVLK